MNAAKKTAKTAKAKDKGYEGFTEEERAAMKGRAKELKAGGDGEADLLAKLAEMAEPDRAIGEWIHALVKANAPSLSANS